MPGLPMKNIASKVSSMLITSLSSLFQDLCLRKCCATHSGLAPKFYLFWWKGPIQWPCTGRNKLNQINKLNVLIHKKKKTVNK